jgi:flagellar hook-associated protein 3 FlgL
MVSRISTYTSTNTIFSQTQQLEVKYNDATLQSSSGLKSQNFEGISTDAQHMLALQTEVTNLTGQSLAIKQAQNRIQAMQNVTSTISDTIDQANSLLSQVQSGVDVVGGAASNVKNATTILNELVSLLNSQVGGNYLFGGSVYDSAPVDITDPAYTPASAPTTANTSYYQGNNTLDSVRASDSLRITYGVTANDPAFEQALRGLSIFIANPTDPTILQQAFGLIKNAETGVASITGTLTANANTISNEATINGSNTDYLNTLISGFRDADTAAAAVQISQLDTQLQASYSSLSKLLTLRLTDYLK